MRRVSGKFPSVLTSALLLGLASLTAQALDITNWVAFNDHNRGSRTKPSVTAYSLTQSGNAGQPAGGPLTNYLTGQRITSPSAVGMSVSSVGYINGTTGTSQDPRAGTPAYSLFYDIVDFTVPSAGGDGSALYFAPIANASSTAITTTFTNLNPGSRYFFRGTAVRGGSYPARWTLATITGVDSATPAHTWGTGSPASPGIVTNGWSPYGDYLIPGRQAGWNSGDNRCGDVIGWDNIVPSGTSFSVICSNMYVANPTHTVPNTSGGTTTIDNYGYGLAAVMLLEVVEGTPPVIAQEPADTTVEELRAFSLHVEATGPALQFQWYKRDVGVIEGATSPTYSVTNAALEDAGTYYVVVSNPISSVTSRDVVVTVDPDDNPPFLVQATALPDFTNIVVQFSEPMDPVVAGDAQVYYFEGPNGQLYVMSAMLTNNNTAVVIETEPQTAGTTYTLMLFGLPDVKQNQMADTNYVLVSCSSNLLSGAVFEVYNTGAGTVVSNLTDSPLYPNDPNVAFLIPDFNTRDAYPDDSHDYFGGRIRSYFIPPFSGKWRLFIRSDDSSELWFNPTGSLPAGKTLVAYEPGCCNAFQEPGATQTSAAMDLVAGQRYYLEAIYKEGGGNDFCWVAARMEGDPTPAASLVPMNATSMGVPGIPAATAGTLSFTLPPANVSVEQPAPATFVCQASETLGGAIWYQWQRNDGSGTFTNLPGANVRTYQLPVTLASADNGAEFRCVATTADATVTSDVATLTVIADITGPTVTSARASGQTAILVTFSEPVDSVTASVPTNYQLCDSYNLANCTAVVGATVTAPNQVLLQTETPDPALIYRVTAINVTDTNGNVVAWPNFAIVHTVYTFRQDVNGYTGTVDTHVRSDEATTEHGANATVLADNLSPLSHGLLRFDSIFGGASWQMPVGFAFDSAILRLRTDNWGNPIRVHRMLVTWDEASTWNNVGSANDGVSTSAGDAVATADVTFTTGSTDGTTGEFREVDVTASMRVWAANPTLNYGWALIDSGDDGYQFNSSEAADVNQRPELVVTYAPSGETNPIVIVTEPVASTNINEGQSVSLSVTATGTFIAYQWYKDDVAIPGAMSASYAITDAVETNSGKYYCVITNFVPSSAQTIDALVTVIPDTNGPVVASALGTADPAVITITFSKPVVEAEAENTANYAVTPAYGGAALNVFSAELAANGTTLTLTTDPRTMYVHYQLTVQNIHDLAYRRNVLNPNPTKLFLPTQIPVLGATSSWKYYDQAVDLGTEWYGTSYVDTGWNEGMALLYAIRFNAAVDPVNFDVTPNTMIAWTNAAGITNITYYFRTLFTLPAAPPADVNYQLQVRPIIDDGAVFYVNGYEARRVGMTDTGPITYSTFANRTIGSTYRFEGPYDLPTSNLVFGAQNLIAVEVHQVNLTSSDADFAAELLLHTDALEVSITSVVDAGGNITLTWPPVVGYQLYQADQVDGPYTLAPNVVGNSLQIPAPQVGTKFYRLQNP